MAYQKVGKSAELSVGLLELKSAGTTGEMSVVKRVGKLGLTKVVE
jgi:hypothetical protein